MGKQEVEYIKEMMEIVNKLPIKVRKGLDEINEVADTDRRVRYARIYVRALVDADVITANEYAKTAKYAMLDRKHYNLS